MIELAHNNRHSDLIEHLDSLMERHDNSEPENYTQSPVVGALLAHYAGRIRAAGVAFCAQVSLPRQIPVDNYDMCVVLGNLLDNALQATSALPDKQRRIKLVVRWKEPQLAVRVENTCDGTMPKKGADGALESHRPGGGFGTRSIRAVADKYGGVYENEWDAGTFTAFVLLGR